MAREVSIRPFLGAYPGQTATGSGQAATAAGAGTTTGAGNTHGTTANGHAVKKLTPGQICARVFAIFALVIAAAAITVAIMSLLGNPLSLPLTFTGLPILASAIGIKEVAAAIYIVVSAILIALGIWGIWASTNSKTDVAADKTGKAGDPSKKPQSQPQPQPQSPRTGAGTGRATTPIEHSAIDSGGHAGRVSFTDAAGRKQSEQSSRNRSRAATPPQTVPQPDPLALMHQRGISGQYAGTTSGDSTTSALSFHSQPLSFQTAQPVSLARRPTNASQTDSDGGGLSLVLNHDDKGQFIGGTASGVSTTAAGAVSLSPPPLHPRVFNIHQAKLHDGDEGDVDGGEGDVDAREPSAESDHGVSEDDGRGLGPRLAPQPTPQQPTPAFTSPQRKPISHLPDLATTSIPDGHPQVMLMLKELQDRAAYLRGAKERVEKAIAAAHQGLTPKMVWPDYINHERSDVRTNVVEPLFRGASILADTGDDRELVSALQVAISSGHLRPVRPDDSVADDSAAVEGQLRAYAQNSGFIEILSLEKQRLTLAQDTTIFQSRGGPIDIYNNWVKDFWGYNLRINAYNDENRSKPGFTPLANFQKVSYTSL